MPARVDIDRYGGVDRFAGKDSTAGIQQAIADGEREAATEYILGPGSYLFQPLLVKGSNLTFHARGRTRLIFTAPTGHGFRLLGGPSATNRQHDVRFEGLEMDGSSGYGHAWDTENKAIAQFGGASAYFDAISFVGCDLHGWRGELIYGGGYSPNLGRVRIEDCDLHDGSGDGISHSGEQVVRRNRIRKFNANGIENTYDHAPLAITENEVWDCDLDGINIQTLNADEPYAAASVEGNRLRSCKRSAITGQATRNAWVIRNRSTDCGWASAGHAPFYFDQSGLWQGSSTRDLHVRDNDVVVAGHPIRQPLIVTGQVDGMLDVEQPRVWPRAVA